MYDATVKKVTAFFDDESNVWVARSDDIVGLNTEAPTLDELRTRVFSQAKDLLVANASKIEDLLPQFELVISESFAIG